jgi:hypothetical protein
MDLPILIWLIILPFIIFLRMKSFKKKSLRNPFGIQSLDLYIWLLVSVAFLEFNIEMSYGILDEKATFYSLIRFLTMLIFRNCYSIFATQILLFFISIFFSLRTRNFYLLWSSLFLMCSNVFIFLQVATYI